MSRRTRQLLRPDLAPVGDRQQDRAARGRTTCPRRPPPAAGRGPSTSGSRGRPGRAIALRPMRRANAPSRTRPTSGSTSGTDRPASRNGTTSPDDRDGRLGPAPLSQCPAARSPARRPPARSRRSRSPSADHLGDPSGGQRRHRRPVLDPFGVGRRDQLERDGLGQEAGFHGKTLGGEAEVGQARLGRSRHAAPARSAARTTAPRAA